MALGVKLSERGNEMKELCEHDRIIGSQVCTQCPSGTAEGSDWLIEDDDEDFFWDDLYTPYSEVYACRGNRMDRSDCILHDRCRFHDNEIPCGECSLPEYGPAIEDSAYEACVSTLKEIEAHGAVFWHGAFGRALELVGSLQREVKVLRDMQRKKADRGCMPDAAEGHEKEGAE